jgi:hypothetical protein
MAQLMTVVSFSEMAPAEHVSGRLRDAGFYSEIRDESGEQKWLLLHRTPRYQMRVLVPEEQAEAATAKLLEWAKTEPLLAGAARCPECGSFRVEFGQFSRRTIMGALPAVAAATGVIERDFYCESCHYTWPAEPPEPEPERDVLNWSKK